MEKRMKTHEQLGITFAEFGALLGTRTMLAQGVLKSAEGAYIPKAGEHEFNMNVACRTKDCGSVGCIGGHMGLIMGMTATKARAYIENGRSKSLETLFFPASLDLDYTVITVEEAIEAIDNFLLTGQPNWADVTKARTDDESGC